MATCCTGNLLKYWAKLQIFVENVTGWHARVKTVIFFDSVWENNGCKEYFSVIIGITNRGQIDPCEVYKTVVFTQDVGYWAWLTNRVQILARFTKLPFVLKTWEPDRQRSRDNEQRPDPCEVLKLPFILKTWVSESDQQRSLESKWHCVQSIQLRTPRTFYYIIQIFYRKLWFCYVNSKFQSFDNVGSGAEGEYLRNRAGPAQLTIVSVNI